MESWTEGDKGLETDHAERQPDNLLETDRREVRPEPAPVAESGDKSPYMPEGE
jgi:hypothetical protein